jgi:hypothetical protein
VTVRYNPEDDRSILVYEAGTGTWICEAGVMGRPESLYAVGDLKADATRYRRELLERTKARMAQAAREGRVAQTTTEALGIAAALGASGSRPADGRAADVPIAGGTDVRDRTGERALADGVEALVAALEAQARGTPGTTRAASRAAGGSRGDRMPQ